MTKLSIDLFNALTLALDYAGSNRIVPLRISKEGFEELKSWAAKTDLEWEGVEFKKQYSDEKYAPHENILPIIDKENPEIRFNGYIFKLEIIK